MDVTTRNRTELKSYFVKNSIPTESNFAELIEGMLNQKDDGLVKLPDNPLSIEAAGDEASPKRAINFYRNFSDPNPDWILNLNPRRDPKDPASAQLGFNISDGEGNSRLFIDRSTGNVGIGTTKPGAKLVVEGTAQISNGKGYAIGQGFMASGSLTIGSINADYGGGNNWNNNTAGLLLETKNNTEIAVHDSGTRIASLMYYEGDAKNKITIGRDMGWGAISTVAIHGNVGIGATNPQSKLDVAGPIFEKLDVIKCGNQVDWYAKNHPIMQYFKDKLQGKPIGTMVRAIQDKPDWRGHYWQGWVDADKNVRVIHNYHNTTYVCT